MLCSRVNRPPQQLVLLSPVPSPPVEDKNFLEGFAVHSVATVHEEVGGDVDNEDPFASYPTSDDDPISKKDPAAADENHAKAPSSRRTVTQVPEDPWKRGKTFLCESEYVGIFTFLAMSRFTLDENLPSPPTMFGYMLPHYRSQVQFVREKVFLVVLLFVQLVTPFLLFWVRLDEYRKLYGDELSMFCPRGADTKTRVLAFCVAGMYFSRVLLLLEAKRERPLLPVDQQYGREGPVIQLFITMDYFMHTAYEAVAYVLNLGIVFLSPDPFEMVLNALAIEFIVKLDDDVMKTYRAKFHPGYVTMLKLLIPEKIPPCMYLLSEAIYWSGFIIVVLAAAIIHCCLVYFPLCKPGFGLGPNNRILP